MLLYIYCEGRAFLSWLLGVMGRLLWAWLARLIRGPENGRWPLARLALSICVMAVFAYGFVKTGLMQAAARTSVPALERGWEVVRHPLPLYGFGGTDFGVLTSYEARRHIVGGGRQDFLAFGRFELDQKRYLTASFYRPRQEKAPDETFFTAMMRRAAQSGLSVSRLDQPSPQLSRFGVLEVADARLYAQSHSRNCLAYRLRSEDVDFDMAGFACGGAQVIDRLALVCAIDRVDILAAGDDDALVQFFTRSESRRSPACVTKMGPGQKTALWLDASAPIPPLRHERGQIRVGR